MVRVRVIMRLTLKVASHLGLLHLLLKVYVWSSTDAGTTWVTHALSFYHNLLVNSGGRYGNSSRIGVLPARYSALVLSVRALTKSRLTTITNSYPYADHHHHPLTID
jgi:hypothetical protein